MNKGLIQWDKIRYTIETSKDIEELTSLKNKLRAYQILAEQSKQSQEVQAKIAIYKARADRKCGEWLKENVKAGNPQLCHNGTIKLESIGVNRKESSRLQKIADIPENKFESILLEAEVETKKITNNMLVNIAKEAERKLNIDNQKEEIKKGINNPNGKFDLIVFDPPWSYGTNYNLNSRRVANPYPEMSLKQIQNIKLPAEKNCILWFWTTHKFIWDAKEIMTNWEFEYKAILVWNKEKMGMGDWLRMQCEFCLIGIKGKPVWGVKNLRDIVSEPRREHSRKPEIFYNIIDTNFVGRKLDYFSREKRIGWERFGNDIDKFS
jgi:N6-adenosine-specific RNA methylase IME4